MRRKVAKVLDPEIDFKQLMGIVGGVFFLQDKGPDFDIVMMNLYVLKELQDAHIHHQYSPEFKPRRSMVPCVYRGETYLADPTGNLWALDSKGYLSIWFVGKMHGYDGVEGFVTDLLRYGVGGELEAYLGKYLVENIANPSGE